MLARIIARCTSKVFPIYMFHSVRYNPIHIIVHTIYVLINIENLQYSINKLICYIYTYINYV